MLRLALATVRERWPALTGAFVALALGAALAISAAQVLAAADDASPRGVGRYAAAPIVVTAPLRSGEEPIPHRAALSPALIARVASLPEVDRVVSDRAIIVRDHGVAVTARPWSARLGARLISGRPPTVPGEIAAPRDLATLAGPLRVRVVGRVDRGMFFSDAEAARLAPRVEALAVWPRSAAPAVRKAVSGRAVVLTGADGPPRSRIRRATRPRRRVCCSA